MRDLNQLHQDLAAYDLLQHPFYQAWNQGTLSRETLQQYAEEYYHHVAAFPRYISSIHSKCADLAARQVLLGNLIEEEQGENNHPELWKRFAAGLGCNASALDAQAPPQLASTKALVDGFFTLTEQYTTGLGALYAYERQTPKVADSKITGLKQFYAMHNPEALAFFEVHKQADEWHTAEVAALIEKLPAEQQAAVHQGAIAGAKLLWEFLDGIVATMH